MDNIAKEVGQKIRTYRKQLNMTLEDLAIIICKSKSTVAKYESGTVALDIYTLNDIAKAFNINAYQLLFFPKTIRNQHREDILTRPFGDCDEFFLYYYDGRKHDYMKSYLRIFFKEEENSFECLYYLGLKDYETYEDCDFMYKGTMDSHDFVTYFHLINLVNPVDKVTICILNPLHQNTKTWGIFFGMLSNPIAPYVTKVLTSKQLIADSQLKNENLFFSKQDLKIISKYNMFYLIGEDTHLFR